MPVSLPPADLPRATAPAAGASRRDAASDKPTENNASFDAELDAATHDAAPQAPVKAAEASPPSNDAAIKQPVVTIEALVAVEAAAPVLAPILELAAAAKPTPEAVSPSVSTELAIKAEVATQPSVPAANIPDAPPAPLPPAAANQNELAANAAVTAAVVATMPTKQGDEKPTGEKTDDAEANVDAADNSDPSQTTATVASQTNIALMAAAVAPAAQTVAPVAAEQTQNKDAPIAAIATGEPQTRTAETVVAAAASAPQKTFSPTVAEPALHEGGVNSENDQPSPETVEPQTTKDELAKALKPGDAAAFEKLAARPREALVDNLSQPSDVNRQGAGIHAPQPTLSLSDVATPSTPQHAQNAPQQQAIPIHMAPLAIGMQALDGAREFQIRLDPDELGRVDVKLTISEDGRVAAALVVDRVETMAMLQRDARTLERAFDQAGLTADSESISFSLRQDGSGDQQNARRESATPSPSNIRNISIDVAADIAPVRGWRAGAAASGVDIRV